MVLQTSLSATCRSTRTIGLPVGVNLHKGAPYASDEDLVPRELTVPPQRRHSSRSCGPFYFRCAAISSFRVRLVRILLLALLIIRIRYPECILESGAMIVKDVQLHGPLVLNTHGDSLAYVGCIVAINGNFAQRPPMNLITVISN
jgi:hypothetical protein